MPQPHPPLPCACCDDDSPASGEPLAGELYLAPMLAVTDRHFRQLCRLLSQRTVLWSEMVHADAVTHNSTLLPCDSAFQAPCVLQLGGSCPATLARAALLAQDAGYTEVNLNCGCPSGKVCHKADEAACFGAVLMRQPELAGECLRRMAEAVDVPVSVKCRLGVGPQADYDSLLAFVAAATAASGIRRVTVHARAALLTGLSPAANRTVPPLQHGAVYRLKRELPGLHVTLNGGITDLASAGRHLAAGVDGVMLGRALQRNPLLLAGADALLAGEALSREALAARQAEAIGLYRQYIDGAVVAAERAGREGLAPAYAGAQTRQRAERHLGIAAVARFGRQGGADCACE